MEKNNLFEQSVFKDLLDRRVVTAVQLKALKNSIHNKTPVFGDNALKNNFKFITDESSDKDIITASRMYSRLLEKEIEFKDNEPTFSKILLATDLKGLKVNKKENEIKKPSIVKTIELPKDQPKVSETPVLEHKLLEDSDSFGF